MVFLAAVAGLGAALLLSTRRAEQQVGDHLHRTLTAGAPPDGRLDGPVTFTARTTAGPAGPHRSPLTGTGCVWYRIRVTRHDEEGENGRDHLVHEQTSDPDRVAVTVPPDTVVLLHPGLCERSPVPGRRRDLIEQTVTEHTEPATTGPPSDAGPHLTQLRRTGRIGDDALRSFSCTTRFTVTEDIVRAGVDVLVAGTATTTGDTTTITPLPGSYDGVTTRTAGEITDHIGTRRRWEARIAVGLAALAVVLGVPAIAMLLT